MWFTIAFFSIPIAAFLLYRGLTEYNRGGKKKIIFGIGLILTPIIFFFIEHESFIQIEQDLVRIFYSQNDTLVLNNDKTFAIKSLDSIQNGQWELDTNDKLIVLLKISDGKNLEMELKYVDGLPYLVTDPYHLDYIKSKLFRKNKAGIE